MNMTRIPSIEVESVHGTREVSLVTRNFMKRRMFIAGEIDAEMADEFMAQMLYLGGEGNNPVTIYINSRGGEINAGLMIYDIIQGSKLPINTVCTGMAASMAAILLAGGQKGRRYILPHSRIMIHEPLIAGGLGGSATSIKNISESILETKTIVNGILSKHTGKSEEEIDKATAYDNFMNASEAIDFGICDEVIENVMLTD